MRISRDEYLMNEATNASRRSTCHRLQVGAILAREGRVIVSGYNGAPSGFPHCNPTICRLDKPCIRTVHAEMNCIAFAARHGIETMQTVMYTTDSPCTVCAQLIINAGIREVVYEEPYRDASPILLLQTAGIAVRKYATES